MKNQKKKATRPGHILAATEFAAKYKTSEPLSILENHALNLIGYVLVHEVEGGKLVAVVHHCDADDAEVIEQIERFMPDVEQRRNRSAENAVRDKAARQAKADKRKRLA